MKSEVQCFSCQKKIQVLLPVGRREECPHFGADVHVCLKCNLYDRSSYHECREPSSDLVKDKDRANYCDHFVLRVGEGVAQKTSENLRAQAEALFKKQS